MSIPAVLRLATVDLLPETLRPVFSLDGQFDLSDSTQFTSLQTLYLGGTQVSDVSPLAQLTSLQTLHLYGTKVSDEAVEKFHLIRQEAGLSKVRIDR